MLFFIAGTIIAMWPDSRAALRAEAREKEEAKENASRREKGADAKGAREKVREKV